MGQQDIADERTITTEKGAASLRSYALVTAAYWAFTLTDGALRMLVLLHFHQLGYSPLQLASLFLVYELMGIVTNLLGGMLAARVGLKRTLVLGSALQVGALGMLSALDTSWSIASQVTYVLLAQGVSGIAKDLTKLSGKTALKWVVPERASGQLFRWVALLTGSKNALKGAGFFLGGALLTSVGFGAGLLWLAGLIVASLALVQAFLPSALGKPKRKPPLGDLLSQSRAVNCMALARVCLFCARDVWFVVALPVYFHETLGWSFVEVSAFMALWVVGYGAVQSVAPKLLARLGQNDSARAAPRCALPLAAAPLLIVGCLQLGVSAELTLIAGLAAFGVLFAVNSSLHSFLILAYSKREEAAATVGFYYMANAAGRLLGTVLSGWLYQVSGLTACLVTATGLLLLTAVVSSRLPPLPTAQAAGERAA